MNCLVTTLQGECSGTGLKKIDELVFGFKTKPNATSSMVNFAIVNFSTLLPTTFTIEDGFITNLDGVNLGNTVTTTAGSVSIPIRINSENTFIKIKGKFLITSLGTVLPFLSPHNGWTCKYFATIDTDEFMFLNQLEDFVTDHTLLLKGDLQKINNSSLRWIKLFNPYHTIDIPYNNFEQETSGNFDSIVSAPKLQTISMGFFSVPVDISKFSESATSIEIWNGRVVGNLDDAYLPNLTQMRLGYGDTAVPFELSGTIDNFTYDSEANSTISLWDCPNVSGNIGRLGKNCFYFQSGNNSTFHYEKDVNRNYILCANNIHFSSGLDEFLIEQAKLPIHPTANNGEAVGFRSMALFGEKTSASNAAVNTLKSKGFELFINAVLQ